LHFAFGNWQLAIGNCQFAISTIQRVAFAWARRHGRVWCVVWGAVTVGCRVHCKLQISDCKL
jgi:hypothetical protein